MRRFGSAVALASAPVLVGAAAVGAHRPWFTLDGAPDPARPYELTDLDVSQVVSGALGAPGRVGSYALTVEADFGLDLQVVVPDVPVCAAFRPTMTLIGPGLPPDPVATPSAGGDLPARVATPGVEGGVVVVAGEEWGIFFEPFTGTTDATGPRMHRRLAGGGSAEGDSGSNDEAFFWS